MKRCHVQNLNSDRRFHYIRQNVKYDSVMSCSIRFEDCWGGGGARIKSCLWDIRTLFLYIALATSSRSHLQNFNGSNQVAYRSLLVISRPLTQNRLFAPSMIKWELVLSQRHTRLLFKELRHLKRHERLSLTKINHDE